MHKLIAQSAVIDATSASARHHTLAQTCHRVAFEPSSSQARPFSESPLMPSGRIPRRLLVLRPAHLASLRAILDDPEASSNDRLIALDLLKNANIVAATG
jgi:hypothetical protein